MTNIFRKDCKCDTAVAREEYSVRVGDSLQFDAYIYENTELEDLFDLTGSTVEMLLVDDKINPSVSVTKTVGDGITLIDEVNGHIRIILDPTDTASLGIYGGIMYYDIKLTDTNTNLFTVSSGRIRLVPDSG